MWLKPPTELLGVDRYFHCQSRTRRKRYAERLIGWRGMGVCFSATVSFVMAGLTWVASVTTVMQVRSVCQILLAAFPLLFGAHQGIEGILWLVLPTVSRAACIHPLAISYVLAAEVLWPIWAPFAIPIVEPSLVRRRIGGMHSAAGPMRRPMSAGDNLAILR